MDKIYVAYWSQLERNGDRKFNNRSNPASITHP